MVGRRNATCSGCVGVWEGVTCMGHHDTPGGVYMARRVNMHLDEAFAAEIERHKPKSLALAAYCALLIEQSLDKAGTLTERATATPPKGGGAIESGVSKAVSSIEEESRKGVAL